MLDDLARFHAGEEALWHELHDRFNSRVAGVVRRLVAEADCVDDLVQESWLAAFERRRSLRDFLRFEAWIARIARNVALSHLRRVSNSMELAIEASIAELSCTEEESVRIATALQDRLETVTDMVVGLPPRERLVTLMFYYTKSSVGQIARELEIAPGTVKATLAHARTRLRGKLGEAWHEGGGLIC